MSPREIRLGHTPPFSISVAAAFQNGGSKGSKASFSGSASYPDVMCDCGLKVEIYTSGQDTITPGRRFLRCKNWMVVFQVDLGYFVFLIFVDL